MTLAFNWFLLFTYLTSVDHEATHAIYLSTIQVKIQSDAIDVNVKVFEDDLRDALRSSYDVIIDHTDSTFQEYVQRYLNEHLLFSTKEVNSYTHPEIELNGDAYFIVYQIKPQTIEKITANYFMELFPTQQNILTLEFENGEKLYHIFKKGAESLVIGK